MFLVRGRRMKKHPLPKEKVVASGCKKEYRVGEVEIVSKPIYIFFFVRQIITVTISDFWQ